MSSIPILVEARRDELVVQELPDEILIYDLKSQRAHCLNQTAAFVWNHCDGATPPSEIAVLMEKEWRKPVSEDAVWIALKQLNQANLLQSSPVFPAGVSRRAAMRRLGLAAAVALPLVTSVMAPTAAMAATGDVPPVVCQACRKKSDGACPTDCTTAVLGTCYDNAGCGNGQVLSGMGCVSCQACFAAFPAGATISWKAPGALNC